MGLHPDVFVHALALCESDDVGVGTRIWAFAHVMPGARIGAGCNIGDHVFVEGGAMIGDGVTVKNGTLLFDGVTLEEDVFVGPGTVFTNDRNPRAPAMRAEPWTLTPTLVRHGATLGANVTVICGATVGAHAFVGAGSVVTADVPDYAMVTGNPARRRGWACVCGSILGDDLRCVCGCSFRPTGDGGLETS